jgi:hypothetical protein
MMPIFQLPPADSAERSRLLAVDMIRKRALERLYARRSAVDDLIRSLENYQQCKSPSMAGCVEFKVARTCS